MNSFIGAGVALITPFNDDLSIDYTSLEKLIEYQLSGGVDYLVSLGTTGETATLCHDEKKNVWEFTAKKVAGRVPLMAGIGGNNTLEIAAEIAAFNIKGYSAILSVSPYYNKPTQEGIYQHYKTIAANAPLPIFLYNVPGRTASNMSAATTLRLANDCSNIIGTKEATSNFDQISEIMRDKPENFSLISGNDTDTLMIMALGGVGVISVVGNAFPKKISQLTHHCGNAEFREARKLHSELLKITDLCFIEGNPAGVKAILSDLGIGKEVLRLPLTPVGKSTREAIKIETSLILARA